MMQSTPQESRKQNLTLAMDALVARMHEHFSMFIDEDDGVADLLNEAAYSLAAVEDNWMTKDLPGHDGDIDELIRFEERARTRALLRFARETIAEIEGTV